MCLLLAATVYLLSASSARQIAREKAITRIDSSLARGRLDEALRIYDEMVKADPARLTLVKSPSWPSGSIQRKKPKNRRRPIRTALRAAKHEENLDENSPKIVELTKLAILPAEKADVDSFLDTLSESNRKSRSRVDERAAVLIEQFRPKLSELEVMLRANPADGQADGKINALKDDAEALRSMAAGAGAEELRAV